MLELDLQVVSETIERMGFPVAVAEQAVERALLDLAASQRRRPRREEVLRLALEYAPRIRVEKNGATPAHKDSAIPPSKRFSAARAHALLLGLLQSRGPSNSIELAAASGISDHATKTRLWELRRLGKIRCTQGGGPAAKYVLVDGGAR